MLTYTIQGTSFVVGQSQSISASGSYSSTHRAASGTTTTIAQKTASSIYANEVIQSPLGSTQTYSRNSELNGSSISTSGSASSSYAAASGSSFGGVSLSSYYAVQQTTTTVTGPVTVASSSSYTSSVGTRTVTNTTSCTSTTSGTDTVATTMSTMSVYLANYALFYTYQSANCEQVSWTALNAQSLMERVWVVTNSGATGFLSDVGNSTTAATVKPRGLTTVEWVVSATPVGTSSTYSAAYMMGFNNPISKITKSTYSTYINSTGGTSNKTTTAYTVGVSIWDLNYLPPTVISSSVSSATSYVTQTTTVGVSPGTTTSTYPAQAYPSQTYPIAVPATSSFAAILNNISEVTTTSSYFYFTTSTVSYGIQMGGGGGTVAIGDYIYTTKTTSSSSGTGSSYTSGLIGITGAFASGRTTTGVSVVGAITCQYTAIPEPPTVYYPCLKNVAFLLPNSNALNFTDGHVYQDLGGGPLVYYPSYSQVEIAAGSNNAYVPMIYPGSFTAAQSTSTSTAGSTTSTSTYTQFWTYIWSNNTLNFTKQSTTEVSSTGSLSLAPTPISNAYFYSQSQMALNANGVAVAGGPIIPENLTWTLGVGQGMYKVSKTDGTTTSSYVTHIPYFSSFTLNSSQFYAFGIEPYVTTGWGGADNDPYLIENSSTISDANTYPNGL